MSYDRVLPRPSALGYDYSGRDLPATRTSTLLAHKIMTEDFPLPTVSTGDNDRLPNSSGSSLAGVPPYIPPYLAAPSCHSPNYFPSSSLQTRSTPSEFVTTLVSPVPRKRVASILTSEASRQERATSSSSSKSNSSREANLQFCLCQPDPKIPRPRNAFILFRQHYQASVVAQHPGLANPEISKIIGERWRSLPNDAKQDWKNLAEEEKARHQQQYPDYRYQPRRYGRKGSSSNATASNISNNPPGASVCHRCGGRIIMNPPSTPSTPFPPNFDEKTGLPTLSESNMLLSRNLPGRCSQDIERFRSPIDIPPGIDSRPTVQNQTHDGTKRLLPNFKRQRFDGYAVYGSVRLDSGPEKSYSSSAMLEQFHPTSSACHLKSLIQPHRGVASSLPPDPSLILPPLQTIPQPQNMPGNVEAMVMTIPFINKIKFLSHISPPLSSSLTKLDFRPTGAIVAIEGQDRNSVRCVLDYLNSTLSTDDRRQVQTFEGPEPSQPPSPTISDYTHAPKINHLETISIWHKISNNIMDFVNNNSTRNKRAYEDLKSGISPKSIIPKTRDLRISSPDRLSSVEATSSINSSTFLSRIALVSRYQLTTADVHSCATPIHDSYAPIDHWQWMASLWRGCVGPDLTIYIRDCDQLELNSYGEGNPVENRLNDARTLVVRRLSSTKEEIEEKALRRVGFEVEEYLRH
ncbi:hypothetical protein FQN57_003172 [Myotisia sp. PD_48]|nr:hypothetical protein FQN57_003172 [Myotisia sp. PD_48]